MSVIDHLRSALRRLRTGAPWLPYVAHRGSREWSIGVYAGKDPLCLAPHPETSGPVLTAADVTDVAAEFVADPFMVRDRDRYWMFFEVMTYRERRGQIGLATSMDGVRWKYEQIVLREPFHLSYPCVFEWGGAYYMIPESRASRSVRLYRADEFPAKWSLVATLLEGNFGDPTAFRHDGTWWLFASPADDTLRLFCADRPEGPWTEHPQSPVVRGDPRAARPAGRIVLLNGKIVRFAQDAATSYGAAVHAKEITRLTKTEYCERSVGGGPVLGPGGSSWNAAGMHHVDAHEVGAGQWLACVDGWQAMQPRLVAGWGR